jgi:hypothetical protein
MSLTESLLSVDSFFLCDFNKERARTRAHTHTHTHASMHTRTRDHNASTNVDYMNEVCRLRLSLQDDYPQPERLVIT